MDTTPLTPADFRTPAILLSGPVDHDMYRDFRRQLDGARDRDLVVVELTTLGGDPEVARMMGEDIRFLSEIDPGRRFVFLGKAAIYSAGTTFMSFFATENRYLTRGTRLMIHERKMNKDLRISGPLTTCIATVKAAPDAGTATFARSKVGIVVSVSDRDSAVPSAIIPSLLVIFSLSSASWSAAIA